MTQYRVLADAINMRRPGLNSVVVLHKGQAVPVEILAQYSDSQIAAHVAAGRIEEADLVSDNKKAPKSQKKELFNAE